MNDRSESLGMTADENDRSIEILLVTDDEQRGKALRQLTMIALPHASIVSINTDVLAEGALPRADVALVDSEPLRALQDTVR